MLGVLYNEQELIARVINGEETAFATLFRHHHRKIYEVALLLTHSETVAEELVQEVFLKVWTKRTTLAAIEDFESWLFIVARNDAFKALRRSARAKSLLYELGHLQDITHETDEWVHSRNYHALLNKAISQLPPRQQMAWRLSKEEGLKREEVARIMQIKPDTVKEHLAMAIKNIRTWMQEQDPRLVGIGALFIYALTALK